MRLIKTSSRTLFFHVLKLLSLAIGLLMQVVCKTPYIGGTEPSYGVAVKYGMPYATYTITGTIKAADSRQPIAGINMTISDSGYIENGLDTALTDSAGNYSLSVGSAPWSATWQLRARDLDGAANGSFAAKDTTISIPDSALTGGDGEWNSGHAAKSVNLDLDRTN